MTSDELLAAEFVLGLLEGEDLLAARARAQSDEAFAEEIAIWQDRLAPLADTIAPRTPRAELWPRIEAALASESEAAGSESAKIVSLRRNLRRWQWAGGFSAAAAIVLAFLPSFSEVPGPVRDDAGQIVFPGFPGDVIGDFRVYAIANQVILWTVLTVSFALIVGAMARSQATDRARAVSVPN